MKLEYRPFAVLGFTSLAVLLLCVKIYDGFSVILFVAGILLVIATLLFKRVREKIVPFYISAALILSSMLFYATYENDLKYAQNFVGAEAEIVGVITEEPTYNSENSRYYYILKLNEIDGYEIDVKLRLSLPHEIEAQASDTVRLRATVYDIASDVDDVKQYYNAKGIFLGAYSYNTEDFSVEIVSQADKASVDYVIYSIKSEIKQRIHSRLPNENGETVIALLLGDKENLSDELNEKFKEVGVAPVFAVSGLHLSIWIMGLYNLLSSLGLRRKLNSVISIVFTVFFMLLTGLSPSVCRSGLMMLLLLSGNLFYRKSDSLNSLGFAAFVLCASNPFIVADGGFLMSFAATLGIVTLYPLVDKYLLSNIPDTVFGKVFRGLISAISVSVCATIGVFPVTVFQIGYISVLIVFSNVMITFFAAVCMVFGGMLALTYNLGKLGDICALISGLFSEIIIKIVRFLADLSITTVSVDNAFWKFGTVACVIIVVVAFVFFNNKTVYKCAVFSLAAVICITALSAHFYYNDLTQLRLLDVGNGVSVVAFNGDRKIVMSSDADGYSMASKIIDTLDSKSRRKSDLLLIGDRDGMYKSSILEVVKSVGFSEIILKETNMSLESVAKDTEIIQSSDINIEIWDGGSIKSVITDKYSIAYCNFDDITFLIIFDSYKYAEIPTEYLDADYLVSNGYIPNSVSPQNYKNVFICGEEKYVSDIESYVIECGGQPILVSRFDDVVINIREDNHRIYTLEG